MGGNEPFPRLELRCDRRIGAGRLDETAGLGGQQQANRATTRARNRRQLGEKNMDELEPLVLSVTQGVVVIPVGKWRGELEKRSALAHGRSIPDTRGCGGQPALPGLAVLGAFVGEVERNTMARHLAPAIVVLTTTMMFGPPTPLQAAALAVGASGQGDHLRDADLGEVGDRIPSPCEQPVQVSSRA